MVQMVSVTVLLTIWLERRGNIVLGMAYVMVFMQACATAAITVIDQLITVAR